MSPPRLALRGKLRCRSLPRAMLEARESSASYVQIGLYGRIENISCLNRSKAQAAEPEYHLSEKFSSVLHGLLDKMVHEK
ncbi:MAG: hypothetical protein U0T82_07910 [Bacteroidales bacterium]